jgi:uncharacterized protein YndB with AHSA1/START domain
MVKHGQASKSTDLREVVYMADYDWSRFQITYYYSASRADVFSAWSTQAGLESFMLARARFRSGQVNGVERQSMEPAQAGDKYLWHWNHGFQLEGNVLIASNEENFAFTFGSMHVAIRLREFQEQTELLLEQTGIDNTESGRLWGHLNCRSCWVFFLTNLQSVLERSHDLRNHQTDRVSSMEVGFYALTDVGR